MLILIDQDNVLADFERGFRDAWIASGNPYPALPLDQRRYFRVRDDYPAELRAEVEAIYTAPGFYRDLPPIAGAQEAVKSFLAAGHEVAICTSPLNQYQNCLTEKYEWTERHLGPEFVHRMIVTKDKTLIHGDWLIDDNPEITGLRKPDWLHIVYDQPYNRHVAGPRISWVEFAGVEDPLADIKKRAARGTMEKALAILARVPNIPPDVGDELPEGNQL